MPQSFAEEFKSIPMSPNLGASLERAHGFAREQAHRAVLLEHLLLALTEDPDAAVVLKASNVDLERLGTDVSGYLGGLLEDMRAENGAEPRPDAELLRVMQAAGQAAQQSRRTQIDGAIVLAAVVGDGKSPAAGLLKAHGLTFEEAIRALQKASAQLRSKKYATPAPAATEPARTEAAAAPAAPQANPVPSSTGPSQSVDDILAAARARIKHRTSLISGSKAESKPPPAEPPPPEPEPLSSLASAAAAKSAKMAAEAAKPPVDDDADLLEDAPAPIVTATAAPAALPSEGPAPPPMPPQTAARPQQRPAPPFAQRPAQPGDGTPRPPLPQRGGPGGPPQQPGGVAPRPPPRPARPDRAAANGAGPGARPGAPQRPRAGAGPLVEAIPRRMRVGMAASSQVRISRDKIDSLIHLLLNGRGMPQRPDAFVSRALSVRLSAPDGGFWIEPASPETVWLDTASGLQQDEQISWRWTVVPQIPGRSRLVLHVTVRMVGRDGVAAETAPPDRVIEVMVRGNPLRSTFRRIGLLALIAGGIALGQYGHDIWQAVLALIKGLVR